MSKDTFRPPFTFQMQVVDADGKVVQTVPGPTVEIGNLASLTAYGRCVAVSAVLYDLLKRVFVTFTIPGTSRRQVDALVGQIAENLAFIAGEPVTPEQN